MTESAIITINNLAQSCEDNFESMDTEQQLDYAKDILKQIKNICRNLNTKKYYVRICKDRQLDELDLENLQLYSEDDIKEEYVAIDYVDEDDIDNLSMTDLQEIAYNNDEYLEEIDIIQYL